MMDRRNFGQAVFAAVSSLPFLSWLKREKREKRVVTDTGLPSRMEFEQIKFTTTVLFGTPFLAVSSNCKLITDSGILLPKRLFKGLRLKPDFAAA